VPFFGSGNPFLSKKLQRIPIKVHFNKKEVLHNRETLLSTITVGRCNAITGRQLGELGCSANPAVSKN
jgi:hypothetical protein